MKVNGSDFLSQPNSYGVMLNVDFFQPYKHIQYSLGAIYLTVLNLPRDMRHKQENVILVGLIPGPHEPSHDLNSYLEPLVQDLLRLWKGLSLTVKDLNGQYLVRCALLCVSCDLPAGRKVCGFLGHGARLGCSRCLKEFSGQVGSMNYAGFERQSWKGRSRLAHKQEALRTLDARSPAERAKLESKHGCRYSSLLQLPYFDPSRMLVIDPMHNLFLGSAKHFFEVSIAA